MIFVTLTIMAQRVSIVTDKQATNREKYAAEYLQKKLTAMGYEVTPKKGLNITLTNAGNGPAEGYAITKDKKGRLVVSGNDATPSVVDAVRFCRLLRQEGRGRRGSANR